MFQDLRRDIDRMLSFFGLSRDDVRPTHLGDNDLGGHDEEPDQAPHRELHHGDEEQRHEASVSRLRPQERDDEGGRRVLPLDSVPLVRLAQRTEGDVGPGRAVALEHVLDVARRVAEGRGSLEWLQDALDNLDAKTEDTVPNGQMRLCWYVDLYGDRVYGWKSVLNNDGRCVACDQLLPAESTMTREPLPKRTSAAPLADGADRVQGATEPPRKRTSADPSGDGRLQSNFRDSDEFTRGYRQAVEDHG